MSELNPEGRSQYQHSTQTFILQKCPNPSHFYPHPTRTQTVPEYYPPIVRHQAKVLFNHDCKSYTPAFYFPQDEENLLASDAQLRTIFDEKVEASVEKRNIMVPKPSSSFCFVCLEQFTDYLKAHPIHQKNVASSHAQGLIEELIEDFGKKRSAPAGFAEASEGRKRVKQVEMETSSSGCHAGSLFKETSTKLPFSSTKVNSHRH